MTQAGNIVMPVYCVQHFLLEVEH